MKCGILMSFTGITLFTALASSVPLAAQKQTILYSFTGANGDGAHPDAGLVFDWQGNLYGTTYLGGVSGRGTVFKVTSKGVETVPHSFTGGADGATPFGGLVNSGHGNLYGTTAFGGGTGCGGFGCGTVFQITPQGKEIVLYSFTGANGDGAFPDAGLVSDFQGNLYGTTASGGDAGCGGSGCGTVFKMTPQGKETVLYSFTGANGDGANPVADLVFDWQGNLYGTTETGGGAGCNGIGCGTVFKVTPKGTETVLHNFTGGADGATPFAGLVLDWQGNLYGTTEFGGASGFGTVFKVTAKGTETVLHSFTGVNGDGIYPIGGLVLDLQGNLYGTTETGGAFGYGTVFKIAPNGTETVLYSFNLANGDGAYPAAARLLFDLQGNLYGTTEYGGASGSGTVFKVTR